MDGGGEVSMMLVPVFYFLFWVIVPADFIYFLARGRRHPRLASSVWALIHFLLGMGTLILVDLVGRGDCCCGCWPLLAPGHSLSVLMLIPVCAAAYFYSALRKRSAAPVMEVVVNCLLLTGIAVSITISIQMQEVLVWIFLIPHYLLLIMMLVQNHRMGAYGGEVEGSEALVEYCRCLLRLPFARKLAAFALLCVPLLAIFSVVMVPFGLRADSLVRTFTDTHQHGLSLLKRNGI